jgi:2'-5' RNA ligase
MARRRLGVALVLPQPIAGEIDGLRRAVGDPALDRIRPHVTLVPPVNVADGRFDEARRVLRAAAAASPQLTLELGPPATFLPDNPVLYLAIGGDVEGLLALRDAVFVDPLARSLTWPFVPHVTVADGIDPDRIGAAMTALAGYRSTAILDRVHLLEEGSGRVWEPIDAFPLGPPAVIGRGGQPLELDVLRDDATVAITAWRDGAAVGRLDARISGGVAFLERFEVEAAHRGHGVGTHLFAAFQSWTAEMGSTAVELL